MHRAGRVGCLPNTADVARTFFPRLPTAPTDDDGTTTSADVVDGHKKTALRALYRLEERGLVQRHEQKGGVKVRYWSAVSEPTGAPVPPVEL